MSRLRRQLRQIEELGSPVSLAEGVDVIHVANDLPSRCREVRPAQAMQEGGPHETLVNVLHAGLDEPAELELMPALGNLHRAKLARPVVNVLEQVTMDGTKMGEVEAAGRNAFRGPLRDQPSLGPVKPVGVPQAEFVP